VGLQELQQSIPCVSFWRGAYRSEFVTNFLNFRPILDLLELLEVQVEFNDRVGESPLLDIEVA
jgi:hypothetical protein